MNSFLLRNPWMHGLVAWIALDCVFCQAQSPANAREIRLPITLESDQHAELRARIGGYVAGVKVDIGDSVTEGQVLIELSAPELQANVMRRRQMVRQAEAHLSVVETAVQTAMATKKQSVAALQEQLAMMQWRVTQQERYAQLVRQGAMQQEKLEEAKFAVQAVAAAKVKIEADIEAAEADIQAAKSEAEFARSGIEVAKAELAYAEAEDELRTIRAPFSGLVTARNVDPGTLVGEGAMVKNGLLHIEKIDVLRGVMTIPANQATWIQIGAPVEVSEMGIADALAGPDGGPPRVSRISQALHRTTRTMRVEIDLANTFDPTLGRFQLLSGQYGSAVIQIQN